MGLFDMVLPSNQDFATEVKSDRLKILYRITLIVCLAVALFLMAFGLSGAIPVNATLGILMATAVMAAGCFLADFLLRRTTLDYAAMAFTLGGVGSIVALMMQGDFTALRVLPFSLPIIVFIVGLLLSPTNSFIVAFLSSAAIVIVPNLADEAVVTANLGTYQAFAIFLTFLAALLATQVTGELYQITEWALMNYRNERETNRELFEKREQLQLSLKRSEALADQLQDTNNELEEARAAAEEAKNFRGQFLANMSHELRTPLNAIIGFSETMLQFPIMYDNEQLPKAYEDDLSKIYESGRQLLFVINDILDLAKVDAGKLEVHMQVVQPGPIVQAALSTTKGLIGAKPIKLEADLPAPMPGVWADETRLRQVLLNLLSNAAKYTDEGQIRLAMRETHDADDKAWLEFAVSDTGVGIAPEFQDTVFGEFEQAQDAGRDPRAGAGLGLAITRQLLDLMGGRVWLESEVGVGSTFYFTVQAYAHQDRTEQPSAAPTTSTATQAQTPQATTDTQLEGQS